MSHVVIIAGAPSKRSRLTGLTDYSTRTLSKAGISVEVIQVADLPAEDLVKARFDSPAVQDALSIVEAADAVIVATPVYKASYSGVLKLFLDLLPQEGLRGKVALPLVIGGSIAHLLAMDYALKPVLAALGGRHILGGVYAVDQAIERSEAGAFTLAADITSRLDRALEELILTLDKHGITIH
ncbi:NADPH-dependent FMN reductase [Paenibacillus barcinonensis]|uniref:NADPH-dependent FMN reductase n=1 Tax=Paenibacillus barcinonensis TaxID=198119 RepID=A0A2V4VPY2_PAEBA|nr:NADPH-dependent FMN reductase [Paenibacillus barcinonensis]PYE48273.1 SsuE family FMN reductase [Paenibacillus barcinonensis]QKS56880.1 NADPH-dependent FMN reductase [Paenibacillus barcinonensis]